MADRDPLRWRALAVIAGAFVMTVVDISIVNVALPSIGSDLDFSEENLQWVVTAYSIVYGGFVLLGGGAADMFGRRRVFMSGVALFTLASLACALAWSDVVLIGARAVQGLGSAIVASASLSLLMTTFVEGKERNTALGIWGALAGSGAAVGVLAGGVLTEYLGWESIFLVNIPIGLAVLVLAPRFVRESRAERTMSIDVAGAVSVTSGLALLVYAVSQAPDHGWGSAWSLTRLALAAALLGVFFVIEARAKDPLVPFRIFRVGALAGANVAGFLLSAIIVSTFFLLTLHVQQVLGWSALRAGVTFIAIAGTAMLWAGLAQNLVTRFGPRPTLSAGLLAMTAGMVWYTQVPVDGSYWSDLLPGYLLVGFAMPFSFVSVAVAATGGVKTDEAGLASGLINTSNQIGGAIGVAVASSVFLSHFNDLLNENGQQSFPQSFTSGLQWGFWLLAGIGAVGAIAALTLLRPAIAENDDEGLEAPPGTVATQ